MWIDLHSSFTFSVALRLLILQFICWLTPQTCHCPLSLLTGRRDSDVTHDIHNKYSVAPVNRPKGLIIHLNLQSWLCFGCRCGKDELSHLSPFGTCDKVVPQWYWKTWLFSSCKHVFLFAASDNRLQHQYFTCYVLYLPTMQCAYAPSPSWQNWLSQTGR